MRGRGVLMLVGWLVPGLALGMATDGTLLTNQASATFMITAGTGQVISFNATANVIIKTPWVLIGKVASPTLITTGGVVTFCITYSNQSALASAMNVVITDQMPDNMKWSNAIGASPVELDPPGGTSYFSWATVLTGPWNVTIPATGQGGPLFLRWSIDLVGQKDSANICYTTTVL